MADFTTLFQKYVKESGTSDSTIARASGYSRGYINKIRNGKAFCGEYESMMKAIWCLALSENEKKELRAAYLAQLPNNDEYVVADAISRFISSFYSIGTEQENKVVVQQECYDDHKIYKNKENVNIICRSLIEQEAMKTGGHLRLLMQPEHVLVQEAVKWALRNQPDLLVEQLIGLEKVSDSGSLKKKNIDLFGQLVPVILSQQNSNYKVYYHYEKMGSYLSPYRMGTNFLVTSKQILCINDDFTEAILWSDQSCVTYFTKLFDQLIQMADLLYYISDDPVGIYSDFFTDISAKNTVYTMGSQPCFGVCGEEELFQKYAADLNGTVTQKLLQLNQKSRSVYWSGAKIVSYFTKEGIQRFLSTGWIGEIPKELYRPFELEDRYKMIEKLIAYAKKGTYEPHLINDASLGQYPMGLVIDCYNENDIVLYFNTELVEKRFMVKETSLANCFYHYMDGICRKSYVHTTEETLRYLEGLLADQE